LLISLLALTGCHGSVDVASDPCANGCSLVGWTQGASLTEARFQHVTFVADTPAGAFLYVAGGESSPPSMQIQDVERAAIHDDGTLGPFTVIATLPAPVVGSAVGQLGRTVIIAGGRETMSVKRTMVGVIADDGGVTFTLGPDLGTARHHLSADVHGGFVYVVGGVRYQYAANGENTAVDITAAVERAPVSEGALGPFEPLAPLPQPLTDHGALVLGDALYTIGGSINDVGIGTADVQRALFDGSGGLSSFSSAGALVGARFGLATFSYAGGAFVVGGASTTSSEVLRAPVKADGTLGAFDAAPDLPEHRSDVRQAPVHGQHVYFAGGTVDGEARAEVFIGDLGPVGP
jgi:hypothetical protein